MAYRKYKHKRYQPHGRSRHHHRKHHGKPKADSRQRDIVQNQTSRDVRLINAILFIAGIIYYFAATGKLTKFVDTFIR